MNGTAIDGATLDERTRPQHERPRVIIADPDPLARRVVRDALQETGSFIIVAEARNGTETIELALYYRPDVVLLEPNMPGLGGLSICRRITQEAPEVRVVMFATASSTDLEIRSLRAGANGFLSKNVDVEDVVRALHVVASGEAAVGNKLTYSLLEELRAVPEPGSGIRPVRSTLTTREWEVLDLMSANATTADIADTLFLAEDTVYSHVKNILRKLSVHSRAEAVARARQLVRGGGSAHEAAS